MAYVNYVKLLNDVANVYGAYSETFAMMSEIIDQCISADVEEVKHGRWHIMSDDPTDESECPTEEGWYRIITTDGEEMTDYFFNKPTLTGMGCVYWKNCKKRIMAWAKMDGGKEE